MKILLRFALISSFSFALVGCVDFAEFGPGDRYKEDFHYNYPLSSGGEVTLENQNGNVEISGWDQNQVEVSGTKYAATKELLDAIKIEVVPASGSVRIRTVRPSFLNGPGGAKYVVRVPRKAILDSISTTNGAIRADDIDNTARLRSTNGSIRAEHIKGDLQARTTNGGVDVQDISGNARLQTTNGSIKAEDAHAGLEAETTNGTITASLDGDSRSLPVRLHSRNGRIEARFRSKVPDVRAETTNASITIKLPADASARVRAHTSHSPIQSDFDVTGNMTGHSRHELEGDIHGGGPLLDLSSTNGSIRIQKI